ncbi:hypothetical protein ARMGADRAFT_760746 [Armillaria gallica]|uniref:BHLH domain-containing protein n=1 Tax=Armillaria gallica TaxID=47427 RepID=A0A2H3DXU4_ARMGA|nr:hypothetical protein ARMGADRAFT_760746 [Armillaria gallica]
MIQSSLLLKLRILMACGCDPSWILSHMTVVHSKVSTSLRNFTSRQFLSPMMSYHLCYSRRPTSIKTSIGKRPHGSNDTRQAEFRNDRRRQGEELASLLSDPGLSLDTSTRIPNQIARIRKTHFSSFGSVWMLLFLQMCLYRATGGLDDASCETSAQS